MAPQHTIDVPPSAYIRDDLNFHEFGKHYLKCIDGSDQVPLSSFDAEVPALGCRLDDFTSLPAGLC